MLVKMYNYKKYTTGWLFLFLLLDRLGNNFTAYFGLTDLLENESFDNRLKQLFKKSSLDKMMNSYVETTK